MGDGSLERAASREARERNDVAHILDSRNKRDEPLKTETKASVRHRAVAPQVEVPVEVLWVKFKLESVR